MVCPFCPLRCDDLAFAVDSDAESIHAAACSLRNEAWAAIRDQWDLSLDSSPASQGAFSEAVDMIVSARQLEVSGTFLDIQSARSAIRFAASRHAIVSACASPNEAAFQAAVEREGMLATTLGEAARRADSIVVIGPVGKRYPRLLDRLAGGAPGSEKRVFEITGSDDPETDPVAAQLASARIAMAGQESQSDELAHWLEGARYVVWVWDPDTLHPHAISSLLNLNRLLSQDLRSVLLPISEQHNFRSVALWLAGMAGPVDFHRDEPRLLDWHASREPDVRVWLQPHPLATPPPSDGAACIVIGLPSSAIAERAKIVLRAGVPGLQTRGTTIRGDGTVTLTWHPPRFDSQSTFPQVPTAEEIYRELNDACEKKKAAPC